MEDWGEESPSEDERTEIENQLYSMFYYHSVNDGIPDDLAQKYCIDVNDYSASVSLKEPSKDDNQEQTSDIVIDGRQDVNNKPVTDGIEIGSSSEIDSSSDDDLEDFVRLPSDVSISDKNKSTSTPKYKFKNALEPQEIIPHRNLKNSRYFSQVNETCSSPGSELVNFRSKTNQFFSKNNKLSCSTPLNKAFNSFKSKFSSQNNNIVKNKKVKKEKCVIDLTEPKNKKRRKDSVITISDSEDSDVVVCSDSETDSSDESSISGESSTGSETTDSDAILENFDSILLNTSAPERDYCDISQINTDYDWKQTSSPDGWTKSMRKYYNKPSIRRLTFDYETMIQKIRDEGNADWSICRADVLKIRSGRKVRCLRCQQEGHMKANCTKVFSCHMCGTSGHIANKCPSKICLKCGSKHRQGFVDGCHNCTNSSSPVCNVCGIKGHMAKLCTNAWRSLIQVNKDNSETDGATKYCCHCGKSGHLYEHCNRLPKQRMQCVSPMPSPSCKKGFKQTKNKMKKGAIKKMRRDSSSQLDQFISVPSSGKKAKFRTRGNFRTKKKHIYHRSLFHDEEPVKRRKIPNRVLMLKNARKYKNMKKRLSHTI